MHSKSISNENYLTKERPHIYLLASDYKVQAGKNMQQLGMLLCTSDHTSTASFLGSKSARNENNSGQGNHHDSIFFFFLSKRTGLTQLTSLFVKRWKFFDILKNRLGVNGKSLFNE